jgi:hypothetical protein
MTVGQIRGIAPSAALPANVSTLTSFLFASVQGFAIGSMLSLPLGFPFRLRLCPQAILHLDLLAVAGANPREIHTFIHS